MKKGFYLSGLLAVCFVVCSVVAKAAVPVVTTDPHDTAVCSGVLATFNLAASGTPTYKWQMSTDGSTWSDLADNATYAGTTTDTLKITTDTTLSGRWYRAIATNSSGADTSLKGKLTVNHLPWAGTIYGPTIVCQSGSIHLSDSTSGGVWSSANTTLANVNGTGTVSGVAAGNAMINYTFTNVCGTNVAHYSVRVDAPASPLPITGPSATCAGGAAINLANANTVGTGVWSASNTSATVSSSGVVTGVVPGSVNITYTFTNACNSVTTTTTVQVESVMNHGVISGPTTVCRGSFITLNETVGGGIWMTTSTNANVDAFGNVTGISQGAAIISYYLSNSCGASIATYTVNVNIPAAPITGGDSVGVGNTLTLSNSAPGGAWSSANPGTAFFGTTAGLVTGVAAGTTTVTYTVTNACGTTMSMMTLHVGTNPFAGPIHGLDSVCAGATISLSDSISGGVWSASNTNATISNLGIVSGMALGLDTFSYTVTNAFGSTTVQKIVYVNTLPVLSLTGPNIVALGGNYYFNGTPYGGTFTTSNNHMGVFVSFPDDPTHHTSIGSFVVLNPGTDTITFHYANSCGAVDSIFVIHLTLAGVNTPGSTADEMHVYPNPNQGEFMLNLASANNEDAVVTVTNMVGEKVKEINVSTNKPTGIKLDQPAGVYFLSAVTTNGKYTAKITISN